MTFVPTEQYFLQYLLGFEDIFSEFSSVSSSKVQKLSSYIHNATAEVQIYLTILKCLIQQLVKKIEKIKFY